MNALNRRVFVIAACLSAIVGAPPLRAQSPNAGWEKGAGGKMAFSFASETEFRRHEPGNRARAA